MGLGASKRKTLLLLNSGLLASATWADGGNMWDINVAQAMTSSDCCTFDGNISNFGVIINIESSYRNGIVVGVKILVSFTEIDREDTKAFSKEPITLKVQATIFLNRGDLLCTVV